MTDAPFVSHRWPEVAAIELLRVRIPLLRPHVYAGGQERERDVVLVRAIATDDVEGWGECSTLSVAGYSSETTDGSWQVLQEELAPAWLAGRRPTNGLPMAYAALEEAALDVDLCRRGVALVDALAEAFAPFRAEIEWCAVIGLEGTLDDVAAAVHAGANHVKLKVAPHHDVDIVRLVRNAYPDLVLAVDANGSYASPTSVPPELATFALAYIEQPVAPGDLLGSAAVAENLGVPVALDESITSLARLTEALDVEACSVVSVKPARVGGLVETVRILQRVQAAGLDAFVGGMLETGVGRSIALAVAAQAPCTLPTDAGPTSRYFADDIADSFEPDGQGRLRAPSRPGIGVVPDGDSLERFTVDRVLLRP